MVMLIGQPIKLSYIPIHSHSSGINANPKHGHFIFFLDIVAWEDDINIELSELFCHTWRKPAWELSKHRVKWSLQRDETIYRYMDILHLIILLKHLDPIASRPAWTMGFQLWAGILNQTELDFITCMQESPDQHIFHRVLIRRCEKCLPEYLDVVNTQ